MIPFIFHLLNSYVRSIFLLEYGFEIDYTITVEQSMNTNAKNGRKIFGNST